MSALGEDRRTRTVRNHPPSTSCTCPSADESVVVESGAMPDEGPSIPDKLKTLLIGKPRDLADKSIFTHISLIAFLAWVGLGADGLSSSCYGPPEAFATLGSIPIWRVSGPGHRGHGFHHLRLLQPHHRRVSQRRRRIPGGLETAGPSRRRGLRLRAAGRLRADDHRLDRRGRRCAVRPAWAAECRGFAGVRKFPLSIRA